MCHLPILSVMLNIARSPFRPIISGISHTKQSLGRFLDVLHCNIKRYIPAIALVPLFEKVYIFYYGAKVILTVLLFYTDNRIIICTICPFSTECVEDSQWVV